LCNDRVPQPLPRQSRRNDGSSGFEMLCSVRPKERLLELLPTPLDHEALNRRIEAITAASLKDDMDTAASLKDDMDARKAVSVMGSDAEENDSGQAGRLARDGRPIMGRGAIFDWSHRC
jgi:hypothetical protein